MTQLSAANLAEKQIASDILGNWLGIYIQQLFDKYITLKMAIKEFRPRYSCVLDMSQCYVPVDYDDYMKKTVDDRYLLQQYSQILRCLGDIELEERRLSVPLISPDNYNINQLKNEWHHVVVAQITSIVSKLIHKDTATISSAQLIGRNRWCHKLELLLKTGKITRRDFLKYTSLLGSVSLVSAASGGFRSRVLADTKPRVVSVHDSSATNWNFTTGNYWDHVNQEIVHKMVGQGVMALTGEETVGDAWSSLIPYQPGDAVAIKVNLNNSHGCDSCDDNQMDALPQTVNAVILGLETIGVPPDKIWIAAKS